MTAAHLRQQSTELFLHLPLLNPWPALLPQRQPLGAMHPRTKIRHYLRPERMLVWREAEMRAHGVKTMESSSMSPPAKTQMNQDMRRLRVIRTGAASQVYF